MKYVLFLALLFSFNTFAEPSRSPAVVGGVCDLDIPTIKINDESKKVFTESMSHNVEIPSDDKSGCGANLKYGDHAKNELKLLFNKYHVTYSKKCIQHFKSLGLKDSEYSCDGLKISSITFDKATCKKRVDETSKVSFAGFAEAKVVYQQVGYRFDEKSPLEVQKEQCARVNECIAMASSKEVIEYKKLAVVACKNELTPVSSGRAPAIEKDSSFDGRRIPKSTEKDREQDLNKVLEAIGR